MRPMTMVCAAAAILVMGGCRYELHGRVMETGMDTVRVVMPDDPQIDDGKPVGGARVLLYRDPDKLNQAEAANTVSNKDGDFTLVVSGFGAGWMDEQWLMRVQKKGYTGVEELVVMPVDPSKRCALVTMSRGVPQQFRQTTNANDIADEADKYLRSPIGR